MSGMKRRGQPAGSNSSLTQPAVQMYNPNQYSNLQTAWRQPEVQAPNENNWYNRQTPQNQLAYDQSNYGQQPLQQTNYWQQPYPSQANTTPNYNQQQFVPITQPHTQDLYNNQPNTAYNYEVATNHQETHFPQQTQADPWNWGWGDEDNSNLQNRSITKGTNNLPETVGADDSWNSTFREPNVNLKSADNLGAQSHETNHPIGKLQEQIQQWSLDSQLSQDSSDPLHTSESDKSHILSRSSTVSESPNSGLHQIENYAPRETDMNTSSSTNSLQHENREVLSTFQEPIQVVKNQTPPLIQAPPFKNQTLPVNNSLSVTPDLFNPYKRSSVLPKPHKADIYNNYVNLETMPDNSEHPDSVPLVSQSNKISSNHIKPENNEIASINDRNQYLETGQLETTPGLASRLVVGQLQQQDEPPPGLSRMVLGQTETNNEPPVGLHRMVPGESSSPEMYQSVDVSIRSATIGADTSPIIVNSTGAYNIRETNADGANNLDESVPNSNRRDSIEGQPQPEAITKLATSVRDFALGENPTDTLGSTSDRITRGSSRQDSSGSEADEDREKVVKEKERRYQHEGHDQYERNKMRGRYSPSPDRYRDKKYEKRRYRNRKYDDDTDYYSDKEKDRKREDKGDRHEDYDRKYSSLKRDDKDRKRREHRPRDYGRDSRRNDYYSRYEDDFEDPHRSRPTSRSDSMHDSFRQDHDRRHKDRDRHRRQREPFNPYTQGYPYDPYNSYYHQYQYYENLRRTNPQAYAEWYRKYYQQATAAHPSYGNDDRASVHSGRSSANEELVKDRYMHQSYYNQSALNYYRDSQAHSISGHYSLDESRPFDQTDSSLYMEETTVASQRLTPAKYSTPHVKASVTSGHLVKVFPHYPLDGQAATVEVSNLHEMLNNDDGYRELVQYPGPLVKGVTHKKTIIEYCENKIRQAIYSRDINDVDSYVLMWELLILLLRQNGMVVGTDIAELLMKDRKHPNQQNSRRASIGSHSSSLIGEVSASASETNNIHASENSTSSASILKEEVITNRFREYLIYGSEKEALEWAMKHGLWGHALFLASKLDKRTYANVMTRFANGLSMNDPLQTLYQLLSGKVPSVVTCAIDEKWGDWRPHLAMMLSNTTQRPELDQKAITTLGDTLLSRGSLYAAQFCYLMVQVGFSRYGNPDAKLVLLGSNHTKPFLQFSINEAISMTEIYEYACSLNDAAFFIPEFLPYKYLLATRLADYGLLEKSLAYLEKIAAAVIQHPALAQQSLVTQTCELAEQLKYCDPLAEHESTDERFWLRDLKVIERDYNLGLIKHVSVENFPSDALEHDIPTTHAEYESQTNQEQWQTQYQQPWQPAPYTELQPHVDYNQLQHNSVQDGHGIQPFQEQPPYWTDNHQWGEHTGNQVDNADHQTQSDYWNSAARTQPVDPDKKQLDEDITTQPQISMPNQVKRQSSIGNEEPKPKLENAVKHKPQPDKSSNSGWFGGIFSKLSLRPKNQMKLPDDKNPTIVWDETKKRWINKDSEGDDPIVELKPPPKITEMFPMKAAPAINPIQTEVQYQNNNNIPSLHSNDVAKVANMNMYNTTLSSQQTMPTEPSMNPPASNQPNMFKLQRGRNLKKSYVDVFNPGSKPSGNTSTAQPESFGTVQNNFNYFVPTPINDPNAPTDFLTPAPLLNPEDLSGQKQGANKRK